MLCQPAVERYNDGSCCTNYPCDNTEISCLKHQNFFAWSAIFGTRKKEGNESSNAAALSIFCAKDPFERLVKPTDPFSEKCI